jgi:hypothetical protein
MPKTERDDASVPRAEQFAKSRRGGRPKATDPRTAISVHLTSAERKQLAAEAAIANRPLTVLIRERALNARPPRPIPAINREAWVALAKHQADLEKIADGVIPATSNSLFDKLSDYDKHITDLRLTLLGVDGDSEK